MGLKEVADRGGSFFFFFGTYKASEVFCTGQDHLLALVINHLFDLEKK